jgi:hypothetical protein
VVRNAGWADGIALALMSSYSDYSGCKAGDSALWAHGREVTLSVSIGRQEYLPSCGEKDGSAKE